MHFYGTGFPDEYDVFTFFDKAAGTDFRDQFFIEFRLEIEFIVLE